MKENKELKIRFILCAVLIALLLIGWKLTPVHADTISYTSYNKPSEWASEAVMESVRKGLVAQEKYPLDFHKPISREDFASLIVKLYEKLTDAPVQARTTFQDTTDEYVEKVAGLGIVTGVGNGQFHPKGSLTREQAATIIERLLTSLDHPYQESTPALYADADDISEWAKSSIEKITAEGILTGVGNNKFAPKDTYTTEQAIVTILRTYEHHISKTMQKVLSADYVRSQMLPLKADYPTGLTWTNDNYYEWQGGIYSGGYGCAGFAFMLSDAAFDKLPARKHTDFNNIRVGDVVRVNKDTHSVIVIDIKGDVYTVAEGNFNSSVNWGRTYTQAEFNTKGTHVITRYPEN